MNPADPAKNNDDPGMTSERAEGCTTQTGSVAHTGAYL